MDGWGALDTGGGGGGTGAEACAEGAPEVGGGIAEPAASVTAGGGGVWGWTKDWGDAIGELELRPWDRPREKSAREPACWLDGITEVLDAVFGMGVEGIDVALDRPLVGVPTDEELGARRPEGRGE